MDVDINQAKPLSNGAHRGWKVPTVQPLDGGETITIVLVVALGANNAPFLAEVIERAKSIIACVR